MENMRFGNCPRCGEGHGGECAPPDDSAPPSKRAKGVYIGAPACFALELAAKQLAEAFGAYGHSEDCFGGIYVVGSSLERPDWRDVDVRFMMSDEAFARLFPAAGKYWENDPRWLVMTTALSKWLSDLTCLPIDFQFQPATHANERHKGRRNAIGLTITQSAEAAE